MFSRLESGEVYACPTAMVGQGALSGKTAAPTRGAAARRIDAAVGAPPGNTAALGPEET